MKKLKSHQKIVIEQDKKNLYKYNIGMSLSMGEIYALQYALKQHNTPVGNDLRCFLQNAISESGLWALTVDTTAF